MIHPSAVGRHHLFRGLLPAIAAVLLASALLLLGGGMIMDHHLSHLARAMAMRVTPGQAATQDLDLAIADFTLAAAIAAQGDEHAWVESRARLASAARAYDGWAGGSGLAGMVAVEPAVREFEARVAQANPTGRALDELAVRSALDELQASLRHNAQLARTDALHKLQAIAECQHRRLWIEMGVMALVTGACLLLLAVARRRERITCEEELAAVQSLEESNADLEAFAGRVAHDLRNPLVPILSSSQIIERLPGNAQVKRAAERIERAARRLAAMIDMLLDFSRTVSTSKRAECDVAPIVDDVVDGFRERARAEGVHLSVDTESVRVACEPIVVASPLQNLIENAFKYGRRDGGEAVIEVRVATRAGYVVVEVEDWGPGISADSAQQLFRAFSRGVHGGEGVGLGLATARRLVESRGGSLGLRVGRGGGALFQIRLPLAMMPAWPPTTNADTT